MTNQPITNPETDVRRFLDPILPPPQPVRILIVTDDDGSYTKEDRFGLTELVDTLRSTPNSFATFVVTTAHRSHDTSYDLFPKHAQIKDFRFDNPKQFKASDFDEIWLFGVSNEAPDTGSNSGPALSESEKRIVAQFMDGGGGVFATGDHEDLGINLCGSLPRVRSMRKWKFDYSLVTGSHTYDDYVESDDQAPPVLGRHRHDTLESGHDSVFSFDDQSDDVPQNIIPRWYTEPVNANIVRHFPHPLLCGPKGVINVLPDHMHEGEIVVPEDLDQKFSFDGYTRPEYPYAADHSRPVPDVIAWGAVIPGHLSLLEKKDSFGGMPGQNQLVDDKDRPDRLVVEDTFGAIGAYDGHSAGVGRVVVDSTFHHFFNINLIGSGSNNTMDPVKQKGFLASAQGMAAYDQIKAYYRNIARWMARPQSQMSMFGKALWAARWDSQLRMQAPRRVDERIPWVTLQTYGLAVRETLLRSISICTLYEWVTGIVDPRSRLLAGPWYELIHRPDPPPFDPGRVLVDPEQIFIAVLGAIMAEVVRAAPNREQHFGERIDERMSALIMKGGETGLAHAAEYFNRGVENTQAYIKALQMSGGK